MWPRFGRRRRGRGEFCLYRGGRTLEHLDVAEGVVSEIKREDGRLRQGEKGTIWTEAELPLGALMPIFLKRSASFIGHTTASTSSSICLSRPPTSVYFSVGFSSTSIALTRESYSAGRVSNTRYESLFTPMRSPGFSFS